MAYSNQDKPPVTPLEMYRNIYQPELLFEEEGQNNRRTWSDNLQFYTGSMYASGAISGGVKGTLEGLKSAEAKEGLKLRLNRVLNAGGGTGRRLGNTMGVVGLIFGAMETGINHYSHLDDTINTVLAGLGTGVLFKVASGPRGAAIAGVVGGLAAAATVAGKQFLFPAAKRYVPNLPI